MAKRKTVKVEELRAFVNKANQTSTCGPAEREGWNHVLESFLHLTENYKGFFWMKDVDLPWGAVNDPTRKFFL